MKSSAWINIILAIAVAVLFFLHFKDKKGAQPASAGMVVTSDSAGTASGSLNLSQRIAYINIDTLQNNYEFFKKKKAELDGKQKSFESEIEALAKQIETEYYKLQEKAQSGQMSQKEGEAAQMALMQRQQTLEKKRSTSADQLMKLQESFSKELKGKLDEYLNEYKKTHNYQYVLSYAEGGFILSADPADDITKEVLEGMNKAYNTPKK